MLHVANLLRCTVGHKTELVRFTPPSCSCAEKFSDNFKMMTSCASKRRKIGIPQTKVKGHSYCACALALFTNADTVIHLLPAAVVLAWCLSASRREHAKVRKINASNTAVVNF